MSSQIVLPTVDADFPGGNALIRQTGDNQFFVEPDMRDTKGWWFYWYFRVNAAAGQQITLEMDPKNIGVAGPAISMDKGLSWQWLGIDQVKEGRFICSFPSNTQEIRFSFCMPYLQDNLQRFLDRHSQLRVETLTRSPKGSDVPAIFIDAVKQPAPLAMVITGRHHCCEMMASYTLEGLMDAILSTSKSAHWLRENVDFLFIPFMDLDGVKAGDQGKNRIPHDHNRDYSDAPLYPEVAAFQKLLPAWANGRPLLAFDLHCPYIRGGVSEALHFLEPQSRDQAAQLARFSSILEQVQQGPIRYQQSNNLLFGQDYNVLPETQKRSHCSGWIRSHPNCILATTLEVPYANASGHEVNTDSARAIGHDLAAACAAFLRTQV